jgi:hypothetical protein
MSRLPHFLFRQSAHRGCQPDMLAAPYPPGRFLILISVGGSVDPRAIVWLEGLGQLKNMHLTRTRTRDLPACNIVPQPTMLPCSPINRVCECKFNCKFTAEENVSEIS